MQSMEFEKDERAVDAFRFLKSLKRGDEVWVSVNGKEQLMFVTREIDLAGPTTYKTLLGPSWHFANIHVAPGLGKQTMSITVQQQFKEDPELPYIVAKHGERKVRVVPIGPDFYQRMDEMAETYPDIKTYRNALKNMISKRAKEAPEDLLV